MASVLFAAVVAVLLVLYVLKRAFGDVPLGSLKDFLSGEKSGCGCLLTATVGIVLGGILVWYIITEL